MSNFLESIKQADEFQPLKQKHISIKKTKAEEKLRRMELQKRRLARMAGHCKLEDFEMAKERQLQTAAINAMHLFLKQQQEHAKQDESGKYAQPLMYERTVWKNLDD